MTGPESKTVKVMGSAVFDTDRRAFRFRLDRLWREGPRALICACNPSMAGAEDNDPTIHQCMALVHALGYAGFTMVNVEALVATDPGLMKRWLDNAPLAARAKARAVNDEMIRELSPGAAVRIAAWGNLVREDRHLAAIEAALSLDGRHPIMVFGFTKDGRPRHPMARGRQRIVPGSPLVAWKPAKEGSQA
jgi:hypothetical protein